MIWTAPVAVVVAELPASFQADGLAVMVDFRTVKAATGFTERVTIPTTVILARTRNRLATRSAPLAISNHSDVKKTISAPALTVFPILGKPIEYAFTRTPTLAGIDPRPRCRQKQQRRFRHLQFPRSRRLEPEDYVERLITTCVERHSNSGPDALARIILEMLWEAGYDVMRRPDVIPVRRD
jgi:hypothetical protein